MKLTTVPPWAGRPLATPCRARSEAERRFDEYIRWAKTWVPDLFCTLTSKYGFLSADACFHAVERWYKKLCAKNGEPVYMLVGIEYKNEDGIGWHAHVVVGNVLGVSRTFAKRAWGARGSAEVDEFDPKRGGRAYVAKAELRGGQVTPLGPGWSS